MLRSRLSESRSRAVAVQQAHAVFRGGQTLCFAAMAHTDVRHELLNWSTDLRNMGRKFAFRSDGLRTWSRSEGRAIITYTRA